LSECRDSTYCRTRSLLLLIMSRMTFVEICNIIEFSKRWRTFRRKVFLHVISNPSMLRPGLYDYVTYIPPSTRNSGCLDIAECYIDRQIRIFSLFLNVETHRNIRSWWYFAPILVLMICAIKISIYNNLRIM